MGIVHRHELHAGFYESRHEGEIPGEPAQLGDDQSGSVPAAGLQRRARPIGVLAALDLDELARELPSATIEVVRDGLLLGLMP